MEELGYLQVICGGKTAAGNEIPSGIYNARLFIPPSAGVKPEYYKSIRLVLLK